MIEPATDKMIAEIEAQEPVGFVAALIARIRKAERERDEAIAAELQALDTAAAAIEDYNAALAKVERMDVALAELARFTERPAAYIWDVEVIAREARKEVSDD